MAHQLRGRAADVDAILTACRGGDAGGVLVVGPRGIGRTALSEVVSQRLAATGLRPARVAGTQATVASPFAAIAPLLPSRLPRDEATTVAAVVRLLAATPDRVLVVDDAHRLDDASLAVVTATLVQRAVRVVLSCPSSRVPAAIDDLTADGHLTVHRLLPLPRAEALALLADVSDTPDDHHDPATSQAVTQAGGLPALLHAWAVDSRNASPDDPGVVAPTGVGATFRRTVRRHLDAVAPEGIEVLELVAVGQPLPLQVVRELVGDRLEPLEEAGHLRTVAGEHTRLVSLARPGDAAALRSGVGTIRHDRLRGQVARRLLATDPVEPGDRARAVRWLLAADEEPTTEQLVRAAQDAGSALDPERAAQLGERALAAGGGPHAGLVLGQALAHLGRSEEADRVLAEQLDHTLPDDLRLDLATARARNLAYGQEDASGALDVLRRTEDGLDPTLVVHPLIADRALYATMLGDGDEVVATTDRLLDRAMPGTARLTGLLHRGLYETMRGAVDEARARQPSAQALADEHADDARLAHAELAAQRAIIALADGDLSAELQQARTILARATAGDPAFDHVLAAINLSALARHAGDIEGARTALLQARAVTADPFGLQVTLPAHLTLVEADGGDLAAARADAEGTTATPAAPRVSVWFSMARASLGLRGPDPRAATDQLVEAAAGLADAAHLVWAAELLHLGARLGAAAAVAEPLAAVAARCPGANWVCAAAVHADAAAAGDHQALLAVARQFADDGRMLAASEAAMQASRAATEQSAARRASTVAAHWSRRLRGADTPALRLEVPRLTSRELDVVLRAPRQSSREIADELHITTRTVDNHLHRAYRRLDVDGRDGVQALLAST